MLSVGKCIKLFEKITKQAEVELTDGTERLT